MKFALVIPLIRHAAMLIASVVLGIALAVGPAIADPSGRYEAYRDGVYLPYVNAPGPRDNLVAVPRLRISFGGRGYGDLKSATADAVVSALSPIRERALELLADPAELDRILADSADRADAIARETLARVYERVGFLPRR